MFEIGQTVKWMAGNILVRGIINDCSGDSSIVMCYEVNGRPAKTKLTIRTEKLEKDE